MHLARPDPRTQITQAYACETADKHGLPYELISPVEPRRDSAQAAVDRALAG